ncbi:hypothetical protein D3C87_1395470 [compost metagenome]
MGSGVAFRRQAGDGFKHPVEMEAAKASDVGQLAKGRERFGVFDLPARGGHGGGVLRGNVALILGRAFARSVTRCLCQLRAIKEFDILRFWQSSQAAGVAVDSGGFHGVDKLPVGLRVTRDHGGPARIVFDGDFCRLACHGDMSFDPFPAD